MAERGIQMHNIWLESRELPMVFKYCGLPRFMRRIFVRKNSKIFSFSAPDAETCHPLFTLFIPNHSPQSACAYAVRIRAIPHILSVRRDSEILAAIIQSFVRLYMVAHQFVATLKPKNDSVHQDGSPLLSADGVKDITLLGEHGMPLPLIKKVKIGIINNGYLVLSKRNYAIGLVWGHGRSIGGWDYPAHQRLTPSFYYKAAA
jgi:hypothetical protein